MVTTAMKLKEACSSKESDNKPKKGIKKETKQQQKDGVLQIAMHLIFMPL